MWSARSDPLRLYLSGSTMALGGAGIEPRRLALADHEWPAALEEWLHQHPGRAWCVALGGRLCMLYLSDPIPGAQSIEEAEAALGASLSSEILALQARLAIWSPRSSAHWVAACTPLGLSEQLMALIGKYGRVASLQPWWQTVREASLATGVAMCDDECVTYWRGAGGVVHAAGTMLAPPAAQAVVVQRLQVNGQLRSWRLDLDAWGAHSVNVREEGGHDATATV